ncbi:stromal interaction molecule 1-like [Trematomus bernacchii]|uniref:stromal interaction molecule 1-like n=1 Tax=Trematomus bernacchii TaxID=40690 RepID=UPI00146E0E63|nr:stromal interaction molecule 1-like [Trematomus bernacchii]
MECVCVWLVCVFVLSVCVGARSSLDGQRHLVTDGDAAPDLCEIDPPLCQDAASRLSFASLCSVHRLMDEDEDGSVDASETHEFLRDDLSLDSKDKHRKFHRADALISLQDLWSSWKSSEVYNWTQQQVFDWFLVSVELPQYSESFRKLQLDGKALPRLAVRSPPLTSSLKVSDRTHAQKLQLKALDIVLFGPPPARPLLKDLLLVLSLLLALVGVSVSFLLNRKSREDLGRVLSDLEALQSAEEELTQLQDRLQEAQQQQRSVHQEKLQVQQRLQGEVLSARQEAQRLRELRGGGDLRGGGRAEHQLDQVRCALRKAEMELGAPPLSLPPPLGLWLQLTHEVECQNYSLKKQSAEKQLLQAREGAEKIRKKRTSLFGTFHVAHSSSMDDVDHKILCAKQALAEVTAALREKLLRWQSIEALSGFSLVSNPGLAALAAALNLEASFLGLRPPPQHLLLSDDLDDMDEDILSPGTLKYAAWQMDRRVSDLWPMSGIADTQSPWKHSAQSLMPLRQRAGDPVSTFSSQRDFMSRSDSDSSLPVSHSESRGSYGSKPLPLSSRLQAQGSGGGGGGVSGLEKSSSLGELRGHLPPPSTLSFSCSTRSLCVTSDPPAAVVPDGGQEGEASVSRRRNAFNKIFKKKTARH